MGGETEHRGVGIYENNGRFIFSYSIGRYFAFDDEFGMRDGCVAYLLPFLGSCGWAAGGASVSEPPSSSQLSQTRGAARLRHTRLVCVLFSAWLPDVLQS